MTDITRIDKELVKRVVDKIVTILIDEGVLKSDRILYPLPVTHGKCCTCQSCGRSYDGCMCETNEILRRFQELYE